MILLENSDLLYYNSQLYFKKNILARKAPDDWVWTEAYTQWLADQGAVLIQDDRQDDRKLRQRNYFFGFVLGRDKFGFMNPADATMFVLRWS